MSLFINKDYVIDVFNNKHNKIEFKTELQSRLYETLMYPEKADKIHEAYQQYIEKNIDFSLKSRFEEWLIKYAYFICSYQFNYADALRRESLDALVDKTWVKSFFQKIRYRYGSLKRTTVNGSQPVKVAIIYTTAGGGHVTAMKATKEFLMTFKGGKFQLDVINEDKVVLKSDPLYLMGEKYKGNFITLDSVYNKSINRKITIQKHLKFGTKPIKLGIIFLTRKCMTFQ